MQLSELSRLAVVPAPGASTKWRSSPKFEKKCVKNSKKKRKSTQQLATRGIHVARVTTSVRRVEGPVLTPCLSQPGRVLCGVFYTIGKYAANTRIYRILLEFHVDDQYVQYFTYC